MLGNLKESYYDKIMYEVSSMDTWVLRLELLYENRDDGGPKNTISATKRVLNKHMKSLKDLLSIYKTL